MPAEELFESLLSYIVLLSPVMSSSHTYSHFLVDTVHVQRRLHYTNCFVRYAQASTTPLLHVTVQRVWWSDPIWSRLPIIYCACSIGGNPITSRDLSVVDAMRKYCTRTESDLWIWDCPSIRYYRSKHFVDLAIDISMCLQHTFV